MQIYLTGVNSVLFYDNYFFSGLPLIDKRHAFVDNQIADWVGHTTMDAAKYFVNDLQFNIEGGKNCD